MNLYLVTRWGNPYDPFGPDEKDTNFLVRAFTETSAARLTDERLKNMPTQIGENRAVQDFAHLITEIGQDAASESEGVIHGPWYESLILDDSKHYRSWYRDERDGAWVSHDEAFPKT
jgi:hypothetical protein